MRNQDCIFCKIVNGEIPSKTVHEDDMFKVILDLGPAAKGHALIIPKDHFANIYELPEDIAGEAMKLAKKLAIKMTENLQADGFNLMQNNGEVAGQTVNHFHLHLIPRYKDDGQHILWNPCTVTQDELEETRKQIAGE